MSHETECLRDYVEKGSEQAFAELVRICLPLVYSAALRQLNGDEAAAKDVAQTVFIDLARKARSLVDREVLSGWLYTSTRYAAASFLRSHQRRQAREQDAVSMQDTTVPPAGEDAELDLRPVLDEALSKLAAEERNLLVLRFFQNKAFREVGSALGISEDAARMRVGRALEKLQERLGVRGAAFSIAALGTFLTAEGAIAVPAGLATSITTAAVATAAGAAGAASIASPWIKLIAMTKIKVGIVGAVIAAGVVVPWISHQQTLDQLRQENQSLRQEIVQASQLAAENQRLSNALAHVKNAQELSSDQLRDLLRLRNEVGTLRRQTNELHAALPAAASKTGNPSAAADTSAAWVPRDAWAFAGYATPEATYQTVWWAISSGDSNAVLAALHSDARKAFDQNPELIGTIMNRRDYKDIPGYRVLSKMGTDGEALLTVALNAQADQTNAVGTKNALKLVALKKEGDTWKFCGSKDLN